MTSKTTNKLSPEVRARAVRMVLDHEGDHASRWAAVVSIAAKIGCTPQTLNEWVKKAEVDSGHKPGLTSDMAAKMKALERFRHHSRERCEHRAARGHIVLEVSFTGVTPFTPAAGHGGTSRSSGRSS
jgi:transposase